MSEEKLICIEGIKLKEIGITEEKELLSILRSIASTATRMDIIRRIVRTCHTAIVVGRMVTRVLCVQKRKGLECVVLVFQDKGSTASGSLSKKVLRKE
jgi:hypothetical protein